MIQPQYTYQTITYLLMVKSFRRLYLNRRIQSLLIFDTTLTSFLISSCNERKSHFVVFYPGWRGCKQISSQWHTPFKYVSSSGGTYPNTRISDKESIIIEICQVDLNHFLRFFLTEVFVRFFETVGS